MSKENLAFLFGGLAFGILIGVGLFRAMDTQPALNAAPGASASMQAPAGPMAPTQTGAAASAEAPMMAELRALQQAIQENPRDATSLVRLANIYHQVSMWDKAIEHYQKALEIQTDDPDLLTDLGICFRGKREFERALELFDQAQRADPSHWQSLFNTAVVAGFDLGRFDDARDAVARMQGMEPQEGGPDATRLIELSQALDQIESRGAEAGGQGPS